MAMDPNTLAAELESLTPTVTEAEAVEAFAEAYRALALDAEGGPVGAEIPILPASCDLGKAAMVPALSGMSTPIEGALKIELGVRAFWVAAATPVGFPGSIAVVPPPTVGLAASLQPVFDANTSGGATLEQAALAVAAVLYANAIVAGVVTIPGPSAGPIL